MPTTCRKMGTGNDQYALFRLSGFRGSSDNVIGSLSIKDYFKFKTGIKKKF